MLQPESLTERHARQVEPMPRVLLRLTLYCLIMIAVALLLVYQLTWRPPAHELITASCNPAIQAPKLVPGQALKVMTW
ncbi:endonuclease, partial [Pseudomonas coronafaciens]